MSAYDHLFEDDTPEVAPDAPRKSSYDRLFADTPDAAPQPRVTGSGAYDHLFDEPTAPEEPGLAKRAWHGVESVLSAPARAVMAGARQVGRLEGLDIPEDLSGGAAIREGFGLSADPLISDDNNTVPKRLLGGAVEFAGGLAADPTTYLLGGAGKLAGAGKAAEAFIGAREAAAAAEAADTIATGRRAAGVGRAAAAAFVPGMATGAVEGAEETYRRLRDEGLSPAAAEAALGTALSGSMALGTGLHAAGIELGAKRAEVPVKEFPAEAPAVEAPPVEMPPTSGPASWEAPATEPFVAAEQPLDLNPPPPGAAATFGEVPTGYRPPGPVVDPRTEREFLRPDAEAAVNAEQSRLARNFKDAMAAREFQTPDEEAAQNAEQVRRTRQFRGEGTSVEDAVRSATKADPGQPRLVPTDMQRRDAAEVERISRKVGDFSDSELAARERFYRKEGFRDSGDVVREEMAKRAETAAQGEPAEPIPTAQAAPAPEQPTTPQVPVATEPAPPGANVPRGTMQEPPPSERAPERRTESLPMVEDQRQADRRASVSREVGLPEDHPAVARLVAAEDQAGLNPKSGIAGERAHAAVKEQPGGHVSMDLTGLKAVNDTFGHPAGDSYIKGYGQIMKDAVEAEGGQFFHPSGDEYAIYHPEGEQGAKRAAKAAKRAVAETPLEYVKGGKVLAKWPGARVDYGYAPEGQTFDAADKQLNEYRARAEQLPPEHPEHRIPGRSVDRAAVAESLGGGVPRLAEEPAAGRDAQGGQEAAPELAAPSGPPDFRTWARGQGYEFTGDRNMALGAQRAYLEAFPEADREQFRPGAAKGRISPAIPDQRIVPNVEGEAAAQAAKGSALNEVPRDMVAKSLSESADLLETTNLKKHPGLMADLGLEGIADKPKLVAAIRQDADNPIYLKALDQHAERIADNTKYATEKTKAGEQHLIPGTLDAAASGPRRPTEGREAEGPLFTQDGDRATREAKAKEDAAQGSLKFAAKGGFYSQLERVAEKIPQAMSGKDALRYLADPKRGVKAEEMKWTGLDDYLTSKVDQKVTPKDVQDFLAANKVEVKEVTLGDENAAPVDTTGWTTRKSANFWDVLNENGESQGTISRASADTPDQAIAFAGRIAGRRKAGGPTKFSQYQEPGGENYRELLLTLPERKIGPDMAATSSAFWTDYKKIPSGHGDAERANWNRSFDDLRKRYGIPDGMSPHDFFAKDKTNFKSGHFDEPNILTHVRFNDRVDAQGKKTLFVEEIQSDWAQKGRKEGFLAPEPEGTTDFERSMARAARPVGGVPSAPFVGATEDWSALAMKHILKYAAENGYDRVAWTRGETQEKRYWGHEAVAPAVSRWNEVTKPESIRELGKDVLGPEMSSLMSLNPVDGGVLSVLQHDQVRGAVVSLVPADVVDILASADSTPQQLLRDPEMVLSRLAPDSRSRVALGIRSAMRETGATIRAKLGGLKTAGANPELLPALKASDLSPREVASLLDPQRLFHLGTSGGPEEPASARARTEAPSGGVAGVGNGKLGSTELADSLNAHAQIIHGREGLLQQGFQPPPGEGMRGFYDRILPGVASKLGKKFGATVGETEIDTGGGKPTQYADFADWQKAKAEGRTQSVHSMDITDAMRKSVTEEGQPLFRATGEQTVPGITVDHIRRAFPSGTVTAAPEGHWDVALPQDRSVRVRVMPDGLEFNKEAFKAGYGRDISGAEKVVGSWQRIGRDGLISLAKEADQATVHHEAFHSAMDLALSEREKAAVLRKYGNEEAAAEAYAKWEPTQPNSWFTRILQTMKNLYRSFRPSWESAFERTRSGEAFGKAEAAAVESAPKYATAAKLPEEEPAPEPKDNVREFKIGSTTPGGRPPTPDEAPQVEHRVAGMREAESEIGAKPSTLDRDAPRTWESLDPKIQKILRTVPEQTLFDKASRGKLDDAEVQAMAAVVKGKREAMDTARADLGKAKDSGADDGPANARFISSSLDYIAAERAHVQGGTETARALAARARVMNAGASVPHNFLKQVFREIPGISDKQAAEMLRVFLEDPASLPDAVRAAMQPTTMDKFMEAWKAGLVSAPGTQAANIAGNVGEQGARVGETMTSALIDRMLGGERSRHASAAGAELSGAFSQVHEANSRLWSDIKDAFTLKPEGLDVTGGKFEHQVGAIGGKLGRGIRIPFRLLNSADNWFKAVGGGAELGKLSHQDAVNELGAGASRASIDARAEQIRANPSPELLKKVAAAKLERTYQEDPGKLAQSVISARSNNKYLNIVAPFVKTPSNILNRFFQRSPIGFFKAETRQALSEFRTAKKAFADGSLSREKFLDAKGKLSDVLARPVLGTALLGGFAAVAQAGGMTGSGPTDKKTRNLLRDTGWQPYSFVVTMPNGKKAYVPYNRFEPLSTTLGIAADAIESKDAKKSGDMFNKAFGSFVNNIVNKSYLQGLTDVSSFLSSPQEFASQYISGLAGSVVPNIVAKGAQAFDPTLRDTAARDSGVFGIPEKLGKTLASRIPGLSTTLEAKKNVLGEPVERLGTAATRFLLPVQPSADKEGAGADLERTMAEIGWAPPPAPKEVTIRGKKVQVDPEEAKVFAEADAQAAKIAEGYLKNSRFQRLADTREEGGADSKEAVLQGIFDRAHTQARERLYRMPGFRKRALAATHPGAP